MSFGSCDFCGAPTKGYPDLKEEADKMEYEMNKEIERLKGKLQDWEQWGERAQGRERKLKDKVKSMHHAGWAWFWFVTTCACFIGLVS